MQNDFLQTFFDINFGPWTTKTHLVIFSVVGVIQPSFALLKIAFSALYNACVLCVVDTKENCKSLHFLWNLFCYDF